MQKKVGIITFHLSINYGAVLQCYALQEFFKRRGYSVSVIDYHPDFKKRRDSIITRNPLINSVRRFYVTLRDYIPSRIAWTLTFKRFVSKWLNLSEACTECTIPSTFDTYVIGSDQLWNYTITGGPHDVFFANFKFAKGIKKYITYAVSMELTGVGPEDTNRTKVLLKNFDAISVREQNAITFLSALTEKKISKAIDPTLLVDKNIWESFLEKPEIRHKYILLYQVRKHSHARVIAESLAKQRNAVVVEIASGLNGAERGALLHIKPEAFVGWFKYADCVVTTSFHGTAFSLIFNKPFYAVNLEDGWDNRVGSLLMDLGIADRSIRVGEVPEYSDIDYAVVNTRLNNLRKDSIDFLASNT